ncbi:hypothetical protein RI138_32110 [Streptomyces sp. C11-1]|uniref:Lipoprotein n=1 Tax=Streptomyces durocortorensis TaxID=2811104 RepID=A0ABY9W4Y4_9ACTN|nr:hypothetical protein [Streptomyces durocortorensis]WNF31098.1 hypothetical protein RI138_32110 [Streptomyces durocortorensis]
MKRVLMAIGISVVVGSSLAACTAVASPSVSPSLTSERLSDPELRTLELAEQKLIEKCMAEKGFRYWGSNDLSDEESRSSGYVVDDVEWAQEHGYGGRIQRKVEHARKNDPTIAYAAKLSTAELVRYNTALGGRPEHSAISAELPGGGRIAALR